MSGQEKRRKLDERAVFAALAPSLPRVSPPEGLVDRVLEEVRAQARVVPLLRRARGLATGAVAAAAAAVLVLAIGLALATDAGIDPAARAVLEDRAGLGVSGEAALYDPGTGAGYVTVSLRNLLPAPPDHHYEVWVLPRGSDAMISLGTLDPTTLDDVELRFDLPGPGEYAAVDVSVEEDDGPPEHSDTSLATGTFG